MTDTLTKTAPERIWLQIDPDTPLSDSSDPFPEDLDGITWCADSVGGLEVEYVRADHAEHRLDMVWQPIETAPKDREILVFQSDGVICHAEWRQPKYGNGHWGGWGLEEGGIHDPTHWMSLPSPPREDA